MLKLLLFIGNQYESSVLTNTDCFRGHWQKNVYHIGWGLSVSVEKGKFVMARYNFYIYKN